ncbi:MAG: sigma-70 family RNA polymerase sigma factor [bacterium]
MEPDLRVVPTGDWDPDDPESFGRVYDEHYSRIFNYIRYRVQDSATADDLTSITFHKALDRRFTFDPGRAAIGTWLLVIARSTVTDHHRRRGRRNRLLGWLKGEQGSVPDPETILIGTQESDGLLAAIARLPDRDRDLLGMKFATGHTNRAIAELTGRTESSVGVIVHRAVAKLRLLLDGERTGR